MNNFTLQSRKGLPAAEQLLLAGYKQTSWGDLIRVDSSGRFHAKKKKSKSWSIHYDVYLDNNTHFTPSLPIWLNAEKERIDSVVRINKLNNAIQDNAGISKTIKGGAAVLVPDTDTVVGTQPG